MLIPLWRHVAGKSEATQSRWQWTGAVDDSVFHKYGEQLGLVGHWWSGQQHRVLAGIDGLLLVVVIGDGKLVVPVDFAVRRPDPIGAGGPCRDKLTWAREMLDERLAALDKRGLHLPPPLPWPMDATSMGMISWRANGLGARIPGSRTCAMYAYRLRVPLTVRSRG